MFDGRITMRTPRRSSTLLFLFVRSLHSYSFNPPRQPFHRYQSLGALFSSPPASASASASASTSTPAVVRLLDVTCPEEFRAAVAVRAASFMDEDVFEDGEGVGSGKRVTTARGALSVAQKRRAFEQKLQRIERLMRNREQDGSIFFIALVDDEVTGSRRDTQGGVDGGSEVEAARAVRAREASAAAAEASAAGAGARVGGVFGKLMEAMNGGGDIGGSGLGGGSLEMDGLTAAERLAELTTLPRGGIGGIGGGKEKAEEEVRSGRSSGSERRSGSSDGRESGSDSGSGRGRGRLVGMVDLSPAELLLPSHSLPPDGRYVCALSVVPSHRRRGLGRRLMEAAERHAGATEGVTQLWLHVETAAAGTRSLYGQLGYEEMSAGDRRYAQFSDALNLGPNSGAVPNRLLRKALPLSGGGGFNF